MQTLVLRALPADQGAAATCLPRPHHLGSFSLILPKRIQKQWRQLLAVGQCGLPLASVWSLGVTGLPLLEPAESQQTWRAHTGALRWVLVPLFQRLA